MDKRPAYIEIRGLKIYAYHGCSEQERTVGNEFSVDLRIYFDSGRAMRTDRLDSTVNYGDVIEVIKDEMSVPSKLIENVAYRIAVAVQCRFEVVDGGEVRVSKLCPPVGAQLECVTFVYLW